MLYAQPSPLRPAPNATARPGAARGADRLKIVAAIDFGVTSEAVARFAQSFADDLDASVTLVHVTEVFGDADYADLDEVALQSVRERLRTYVADGATDRVAVHLEVTTSGGQAATVDALLRACEGADLLLVGRSASRGFWRLFTGDATRAILSRSHLPILVIPEDCAYTRPAELVVALGTEVPSEAAFAPLLRLATEFDLAVEVHQVTGTAPTTLIGPLRARLSSLGERCQIFRGNFYGRRMPDLFEQSIPGVWGCLFQPEHERWDFSEHVAYDQTMERKAKVPILVLVEASDAATYATESWAEDLFVTAPPPQAVPPRSATPGAPGAPGAAYTNALGARLVREVMSSPPITLREGLSLTAVEALFDAHDINHAAVVDEGHRPIGIVSRSDLARITNWKAYFQPQLHHKSVTVVKDSLLVGDVMRTDPVCISALDNVASAAELINARRFHALPVLGDAGQVVGMLTAHDLLRLAYPG